MRNFPIEFQYMRIYTKKGRWVGLIILCILELFFQYQLYRVMGFWKPGISTGLPLFALSIFGILHILTLTLFLVPYYFKNSRFKKFWNRMPLLFVTCVTGEFVVLNGLMNFELLHNPEIPVGVLWAICAFSQANALISATGLLYFFEFFEEVDIAKSTRGHLQFMKESIRRMQGTRTDLPYLLQSLRGIRNQFNPGRDDNAASDSILLFADILRYKLYGYDQEKVKLSEELNVVRDSIQFYNTVISHDEFRAEIQVLGDVLQHHIEKQLLLRLIYPFLAESEQPKFKDLLFYFEVQPDRIWVTVQYHPVHTVFHEEVEDKIRQVIKDIDELYNFQIISEQNQNQITVCFKIHQ